MGRALHEHRDFPRSARYPLAWLNCEPFGANPLWLAEWLCARLDLKPGMRVLDLGCGHARSSVFLAREYGVEVSAADLWVDPNENWQQIRDAGVVDLVTPALADARNLPYPRGYFDAILAFDSMQYFGTDCLFLPYIVQFLQPTGVLGFASAGLRRELGPAVPEHLRQLWTPDYWCLRSADWWRDHWLRTGLVDLKCADTMRDGWQLWRDWSLITECPAWYTAALEQDAGQNLAYIRAVAARRPDTPELVYDLRTGEYLD